MLNLYRRHASMKVKDALCVVKKIGARNINGLVRVDVCETEVGEGGVMAKKAFKVVLKTENGQSEFTYAREHDPRSALGLALKRHTEPWIGKPKIWRVYDANEIDSNPDAEPLLTVAAKDVIVPVTWIGSETGKAAKGE